MKCIWYHKDRFLATRPAIASAIHRTPVLHSRTFDQWVGGELFFKCEPFQRMGAFKMRGAAHAIARLDEEARCRGVATHSSGNFAQALALAAREAGIPAWIVMPSNAPAVKVAAVRGYGGQIVTCAPTLQAREAMLEAVVAETGATFIHPFDNEDVILGQGTAAQELIEDVGPLDAIVAPVGGGGLVGGTAIAALHLSPATRIYAAEPEGASDAWQSRRAHRLIPQTKPQTIADGLRTSLGQLTFPLICDLVHDVLLVSEAQIAEAMARTFERLKVVVEPSAAVAVAAVLRHRALFQGKRTGIILSGGNVDLKNLGELFAT